MKHIILGTAGHVDHGKTSLIKALTEVDCDTHPEEKERGITINLGFSNIDLPSGASLGIIDVPGHKDFVNTMISGASSIDMALLVIAADSGIMPQTQEHLNIIKTLGIDKIIVALNKSDLVDEDLIELASEEIQEYFKDMDLNIPKVIPVSSQTKSGLKELLEAIDQLALDVHAKPVGRRFRMYIDRLFTVKGLGSVVTGSVLSGKLKSGDTLELFPAIKDKIKVKSIQRHGLIVESVGAGDRAALNLSGMKREDWKKGAVLINETIEPSTLIDAELSLFDDKTKLKVWSTVIFYSGTFESLAKVHLLNKDSLSKDQKALVQIHLDKPMVLLPEDKFIIRQSSADKTIGGGILLDAKPLHHRKRTKKLIEHLENLKLQIEAQSSLIDLVKIELGKEQKALSLPVLSEKLNKEVQELQALFEENQQGLQIYTLANETVIIREEDDYRYQSLVVEKLEEHHKKFYLLEEGLTSNFFSSQFKFSKDVVSKKYLEALLLKMKDEDKLRKLPGSWSLKSHRVVLDDKNQENINLLSQLYLDYDLQKPIYKDLEEQLKSKALSRDEIKMLHKYLMLKKQLYKYQDDYVHASVIDKVEKKTVEFLQDKPNGINLSEFRQLNGCTKKIIPVLVGVLEEKSVISTQLDETHTIMKLA